MDLINLLFGFQGRIGRGQYWLAVAIWTGLAFAIFLLMTFVTAFLAIALPAAVGYVISIVFYPPMVISMVAAGLKRLHDRNKGAGWLLVFYLGPLVGFAAPSYWGEGNFSTFLSLAGLALLFWAFIELGCLRGSIGANPYGPDPVAPRPAKH